MIAHVLLALALPTTLPAFSDDAPKGADAADRDSVVILFDALCGYKKSPLEKDAQAWRAQAEALQNDEPTIASLEYELENSPLAEQQKRFDELSMRFHSLQSPAQLLKKFHSLKMLRTLRKNRKAKPWISKITKTLQAEGKRRDYLREMLLKVRKE
jgi:hypothetical protein